MKKVFKELYVRQTLEKAERLTVKELKKYDINKIYNISAEDDKIYICF